MPLRFWPACCTPPPCALAVDTFNRDDNADILAGAPFVWTGDVGNFKIENNRLISLAAGTLYCPVDHPNDLPNLQLILEVDVAASGSIVRLILGTRYAEMKFGASLTGYVQWWRTGETLWDSSYAISLEAYAGLTAIARDTRLVVNTWYNSPEHPDGDTAGLYVSAAGIEIDAFTLKSSDGDCPATVSPWCAYECLP